MSEKVKVTDEDAIELHASGRPGKIEISLTKSLTTQRDLALAYSPGVAAPCKVIAEDPDKVYDLTAKGNSVAVISNGTAVLGLGNLGPLASIPVMEGKAGLFKRFADIDGIPLVVDSEDPEEIIDSVKRIGGTFGGINLEDIAGPDCFYIEQRLREEMDIPVFHDDQHGTAIITAAGLFNALDLTGKKMADIKVVFNGAGAAGIACAELIKAMGVKHENVIMCDRSGVIYKGRNEKMNEWNEKHAVDTKARSLEDAAKGADVLIGLSVAGAFTKKIVEGLAPRPIIFAMANPMPEILPEEVAKIRDDVIMATGRSDYPNQVNNVLGFPYIFRGALDVRATEINDEMKIAAARALAELAREDVPDEVDAAYAGRRLQYGPDYIIPVPFDPRLIERIPAAVAKAAETSGVAKKPIKSMMNYKRSLAARLDPTATHLEIFFQQVRAHPKRVVFAEGEQERTIRAAFSFLNSGYGQPILVGRESVVKDRIKELGLADSLEKGQEIPIINAKNIGEKKRTEFVEMIYKRLRRKGVLYRDCQRMVNQGRNVFAACMVKTGMADALVTGLTRNYYSTVNELRRVFERKIDPVQKDPLLFGLTMVVAKGQTVFIGDTTINEIPTSDQLVEIAIRSAETARRLGHEPRVALMSYSNFGYPILNETKFVHVQEAVQKLDSMKVDFEYEGEISPNIALNFQMAEDYYSFSRLSGPANILIMPALHSAAISAQLLDQMAGGTTIGPLLMGFEHSAQIVEMDATVTDIVTSAAFAAHQAISKDEWKKEV